MRTQTTAHYSVRFVLDTAVISTVVTVPHHETYEQMYDDDDSAIDVAVTYLMEHYGLDMNAYKWVDVEVELEGMS